jgi:hypothetical protein
MTDQNGISRRKILSVAAGAAGAVSAVAAIVGTSSRAGRQGLAKIRQVSGHTEGRGAL